MISKNTIKTRVIPKNSGIDNQIECRELILIKKRFVNSEEYQIRSEKELE